MRYDEKEPRTEEQPKQVPGHPQENLLAPWIAFNPEKIHTPIKLAGSRVSQGSASASP